MRYSAYCVPVGCSAWSEYAGDVPCATELRSKELVHPCWLNDGEMNAISFGHWRNARAHAVAALDEQHAAVRSPKTRVSITAQPTPDAPAPTMRTSTDSSSGADAG